MPHGKTVLADEQVITGAASAATRWSSGAISAVVLQDHGLRQRLLDDSTWLDWSETTKTAQRNWIGRLRGWSSPSGSRMRNLTTEDAKDAENRERTQRSWKRPESRRFGPIPRGPTRSTVCTFVVLAPEHPLLDRMTSTGAARGRGRVRREATPRSAREPRQRRQRAFTGAYALHPLGGALPIWIADYVLIGYGTGAIMARRRTTSATGVRPRFGLSCGEVQRGRWMQLAHEGPAIRHD